MRRLPRPVLLPALLAFALLGPGTPAGAADCRRPGSFIEKTICADPMLTALERSLAEAYRDRMATLPNGRARDGLAGDQRRWLAARISACPAPAPAVESLARDQAAECVGRVTAQRIGVLGRDGHQARWPTVPFRPVLREGVGQPLCERLHGDLLASFHGPAPRVNPLGERELGFRSVSLGRPMESDEEPPAIAQADPHGTGRDGAILRLETAATDRRAGTWSYRVFPSEDALRRAFRVSPTGAPNPFAVGGERDLSRPLFGAEAAPSPEPRPDLARQHLSIPEAPRLFREDGRVLALVPIPGEGGGPDLMGVYAFGSQTRLERLCLFETGREPAAEELLLALPEVDVLRQAANALLPPALCGAPTDEQLTLESRALTRPWSMRLLPAGDRLPRHAGTEEVRTFLRRKALSSLEARRSVGLLDEAYAEAETRVAGYYRDAFARPEPEARALARLYLDRRLADDVAVEADGPVRLFLAADFEERHAVHAAALAGDGATLWKRLGPDPKAAIAAARHEAGEPLLSLALEHPAIVQGLLDRGADPNAYGASGFTPLMTAARLGLAEPARLLLAGGADPDLLSRRPRFDGRVLGALPCDGADPTGAEAGLTALALAENAGAAEIAELLEGRTRIQSASP